MHLFAHNTTGLITVRASSESQWILFYTLGLLLFREIHKITRTAQSILRRLVAAPGAQSQKIPPITTTALQTSRRGRPTAKRSAVACQNINFLQLRNSKSSPLIIELVLTTTCRLRRLSHTNRLTL